MKEIVLKNPIEFDGALVKSLKMRAPKVKDQLSIEKQGGTEAEKEVRFLALLCACPMELVEELTLADYKRMQEAFVDFLS